MNGVMNGWSFDGIPLSWFGAVTELDSYLDMPQKRGDNISIPLTHGKIWVPKFFDQRTVSFGIEIMSRNILDLENRMDLLKSLVGSRAQKVLMKTGFPYGSRWAYAEVMNTLSPTRDPDPLVAKVVIDFTLSDPFFRSFGQFDSGETINSSPYTYTINNPGSAPETKAVVQLTGPLSNPVITNSTTGSVLQYDDVLADNTHVITIDCGAFTAIDETAANKISKIVHSGDIPFFSLAPGNNAISVVDGVASGGLVHVLWYPPWL